jgi:hypothetical protein
VFAGGCDLDALAAVVAPEHGPGAQGAGADPLDMAAGLLDVSLVTVTDGADGEPRVGMLETIREYALERLERAGTWTTPGAATPCTTPGSPSGPTSSCAAQAPRTWWPWTGWRPSTTTCGPP